MPHSCDKVFSSWNLDTHGFNVRKGPGNIYFPISYAPRVIENIAIFNLMEPFLTFMAKL